MIEETGKTDKKAFKENARRLLDPVVSALAAAGATPMLMSIFGLVTSLYGAIIVARGSLFWGGVWLLVSGLCDILDGSIARSRSLETRFGAFIDSTFDRVSELAFLSGLIVYYVSRPQGYSVFLIVVVCIVLGASFLISYTRARLEGLGYECKVGMMERPERLALLILGLLLGSRILAVVLVVLALGSVITVLQRVRHGHIVTRAAPPRR